MSEIRTVSAHRRREMIAEAAYYRAEKRGFTGGDPVEDWVAAEAEVDAMLANARPPRAAAKAQRTPVKGAKVPQALIAELSERLEEAAAAATTRLAALRRKLARITGKERGDFELDVERLAELRDRVRASLKELTEQGEGATREARKRAEAARARSRRCWSALRKSYAGKRGRAERAQILAPLPSPEMSGCCVSARAAAARR